ncbi:hypothetical protein BO71DRAFT_434516 [Aspergillus ellipticus CBS 707.79]|uniref:alpha-glucosidase n=1 Tax=Aspergillus ellipticus CBS 707.79 TaxID=1448320 RepID=A0A319DNU8_9EURO|nr:hypothetical protein BO71DRAFT_434516 [Aspergillus ellipticus CBS 707.79]
MFYGRKYWHCSADRTAKNDDEGFRVADTRATRAAVGGLSIAPTLAIPTASLPNPVSGVPSGVLSTASSSSSSSYLPQATLHAVAGLAVQPNIADPAAVDAQACNAYGIDIETLNLTVEYQMTDRLHMEITPSVLSAANASEYLLSPDLVAEGTVEEPAGSAQTRGLRLTWSNEPSFQFNITRVATGDVLFTTTGTQLVFENQFLEFASAMPEDYHLYGLGEVIHGLRLGTNLTRTLYAANAGNTLDVNLYGSHPFYLETRYFQVDGDGREHLVTNVSAAAPGDYRSYSHGVFFRNAHGQDVLLRPSRLTWRAIGGSIDLYVFAGRSPGAVTQQYVSLIGRPAMQRYHTLGLHQCRWGYANWSEVAEVVANYARFQIPLENMWNNMDYMSFYRDYDNDPIRSATAMPRGGQYYIPIVDSGIYVPNPDNASDAYALFTRGDQQEVLLRNPDGSWLDMSERSRIARAAVARATSTCSPSSPRPTFQEQATGNIVLDFPEGFNLTNATEAAAASSSLLAQSASSATSSTMITTITTTPSRSSYSAFPCSADTCGFGSNTDEELYNRWMQLSAFLPFYHNYNELGAIPQEPYR